MEAEIVVHIGAGKTGSSSIQVFLARNANTLGNLGFLVPDSDLGVGGQVTGQHVWATQRCIRAADRAGLMSRIEQLVEKADRKQVVLISAENLSNVKSHEIFDEVGRRFRTRAILYIRRQDELLLSAWQQWFVKVNPELNAWLFKGIRLFGNWESVITDWESVIGVGNVAVRLFEKGSFFGDGLLDDFVDAIGLTGQKGQLDFSTGLINPSLSDVMTSIVEGSTSMFRDIHDNDYYRFVETVMGGAGASDRKVSLVSRAQREGLLGYYAAMNARVCARFFPGRKSLFEPIDHSKYDYLDETQMLRRQIQFLNELIYRSAQKTRADAVAAAQAAIASPPVRQPGT